MRILYLSHQPRFWGGAPQSLYEVLESIDRHKVTPFFASPYDDEVAAAIKQLGIPFLKLLPFSLKKPHWILITTFRLVYFIVKNKINIIHNNQCADASYSWLAGKLTNRLIIIHHRDSRFYRIDKWLCGHVDRNICISSSQNNEFLNSTGTILHNGIKIEKFPLSPPTTNYTDSGIATIGLIGRISPIKGQDTFVEAIRLVLEKTKKARFKIIGDMSTEYYPEYKKALIAKIHEYHLDDYIEFTDYTSDPIAEISALDISICASTREPFGRVIIESLACYKPLVTTPVGAALECKIDEAAIIFPIGDALALSSAILKLVNNPQLWKKMGVAGREIVEKNFTLQHTLFKLYKIYEEIYAEKKF